MKRSRKEKPKPTSVPAMDLREADLIAVGDHALWLEQAADWVARIWAVQLHLGARRKQWQYERWQIETLRQRERERIAAMDRRLQAYQEEGERVPILSREKVKELLTPRQPEPLIAQYRGYASGPYGFGGTTMHHGVSGRFIPDY